VFPYAGEPPPKKPVIIQGTEARGWFKNRKSRGAASGSKLKQMPPPREEHGPVRKNIVKKKF